MESYTRNTHAIYMKKNKQELLDECEKHGLSLDGLKKDLVSRLMRFNRENSPSSLSTSSTSSSTHQNGHSNNQNGTLSTSSSSLASSSSIAKLIQQQQQLQEKKEKESKSQELHLERENRSNIVIHKRPLQTIYYFFRELPFLFTTIINYILCFKKTGFALLLCTSVYFILDYYEDGPHSPIWFEFKENILWWSWWVLLGFLSSCGFGTGLHTFVLYLGPFIAKVTLAAYECKTTDFPPPYPHEIYCPKNDYVQQEISLWSVMRKVQVEAVLWGIGTAIGELPPYFVAKAARLSGREDYDDEELEEFEELIRSKNMAVGDNDKQAHSSDATVDEINDHLPWTKRLELWVTDIILRAGFIGIVACASIPNPLFDLAGMTCGHFNVPFWSFFGATVIGKAFIKMHIQQLFVIAIFTEHHVESILSIMKNIPVYGQQLREPFLFYLEEQKRKLRDSVVTESTGWLQWASGALAWLLIGYFLYSIVNSLAQSYDRRLCKWRRAANVVNEKMD